MRCKWWYIKSIPNFPSRSFSLKLLHFFNLKWNLVDSLILDEKLSSRFLFAPLTLALFCCHRPKFFLDVLQPWNTKMASFFCQKYRVHQLTMFHWINIVYKICESLDSFYLLFTQQPSVFGIEVVSAPWREVEKKNQTSTDVVCLHASFYYFLQTSDHRYCVNRKVWSSTWVRLV